MLKCFDSSRDTNSGNLQLLKPQRFVDLVAVLTGNLKNSLTSVERSGILFFKSKLVPTALSVRLSDVFYSMILHHIQGGGGVEPQLLKPLPYIEPQNLVPL